ncbi:MULTISPECIES: hypothetical protein [unclassified Coleofasciculus]|uniref:hypothetical protein n=1 Tax=unclassified Coleofasciculus TaxID=2692782 RepID=UPI00187EA4B2|nr:MULTISPECIES: hypothetical protein [unclassified Coleofasciculus]MBE9125350.1 hypothetical protein [Coleofasciculus sp. LEGE 07081]MBE9148553.1 hypothetical protein [Coleofasciculus sp. LEGE 07092]
MSFHEQNIKAFIQVLHKKRSLFSPRDRASLEQLAASLPDDEEKISEAIASWYEKRPPILDAQLDILNTLLSEELNATRSVASAIARTEFEANQDYRQELLSAVAINHNA